MAYTDSKQVAAAVGTGLAGTLMILEGILGVMQGIAAIAKDQVYAAVGDYVYRFNLQTWGWIHLVLGVLVLVAGVMLFGGSTAARVVAVVLTSLVAIANFLYLPYQPVWSVVVIAVSLFVIWAVFHDVHRTDAL